MREIRRLSRHWPRNGDELKGAILEPTHLASLVEVLFRHDAVMHGAQSMFPVKTMRV
jgi:hypothetical protein